MKKEHRSRIVAFLLPVLMIFQTFVFTNVSKAEEEKKPDGKYTINIQLPMDDAYSVPKDTDILRSSGRQVIYWNITGKDEITKDNLYQKIKEYEKMDNAKITEKFGEGQLSDFSKLVYSIGDKDEEASEIDLSLLSKEEKNAFEFKKEIIKIPNLGEGTYLIKESDASVENAKLNKNNSKLFANIQTLSKDNESIVKDSLDINMKEEIESPSTKITLVKTDSKNKDLRLDKVGFRLYRKAKDEEKEGQLVSVEGELGVYKYKASEEKITEDQVPVLKTNTDGKIEVSGLPEGETYYFKEVEPVGEYNNDNNKNKTSEDFKVGETSEIIVENDRIPFVKKVDQNGQALKGAKFEVYNKDGKKLSFIKDTDKFGYGYRYVANSEDKKAKESEESNEIKEETEETDQTKEDANEEEKETLDTETQSEQDEVIEEDSENAELSGEKITELVSDEEGNIFISGMPEGEGYYFLETKAPEGYQKSNDKFEFNVDENHIIYHVSKDKDGKEIKTQGYIKVENIKPDEKVEKGGFKFLKVDSSDTSKKLKGAKFKVTKKVGDKYEDVERNGKKYIVESDKNGAFEVKDLELGTYYLKETTAPNGYVVNGSPIEIKITGSSYAESPTFVTNSKGDVPVTPTTPGGSTSTRGPKGPLVKTGDIRILVFFAAGLLLILGGYKMVRSQDKKVNRA